MQITNTSTYPKNTSVMMIVYGLGGVGKTTFAASFPKPLLIDFENGAKYFGERGISVDVAQQKEWFTNDDFQTLKTAIDNYDTIIVDPIGEAMQKLMESPSISGAKYRQGGTGDLTIAGWGEVKKKMRNFVKWLRDTDKNIVIVAHVDEKTDGENIVRRPMIATKLSDELITMVDIVAYMGTVTSKNEESGETESKRVLFLDPSDESRVSKDRTGKLGRYIKPEYDYIAKQLSQGVNETANEVKTPAQTAETAAPAAKTAETTNHAPKVETPAEEAKTESTTVPTEDEKMEMLEAMTIPELQEKLKEKGLPVSGAKTILIMRLIQAK